MTSPFYFLTQAMLRDIRELTEVRNENTVKYSLRQHHVFQLWEFRMYETRLTLTQTRVIVFKIQNLT